MVKIVKHIVFVVAFFTLSASAFGQSKDELENKIESLQRDIELAEKLLKETSDNQEATVHQANLLQTQINQREQLIKTYQNQIKVLDKEINKNKKDIGNLQKKLEEHREEYADLIVVYYRNRNNLNNLLFIFSAESFNQIIKRMRYIQQFRELVENKIEEIDNTKKEISAQLAKNEKDKDDKESLLQLEKKENASLQKDKKSLNNQLKKLKNKQTLIQKDINAKNAEAKKLKAQIEEIIAEELRRAEERENEAMRNNRKSVDYQLSNNFSNNKGKLPWPVNQGIVSGKYGPSRHPTQPKVTVNNNGIDITTIAQSKAKAVFDGEVSMILNTGTNNAILVRHGVYFTLYGNLDKVYVKKGDRVRTGEEIGLIHTGATDNKTILHFELWQDKNTVDPLNWLRP